MPLTKRRSAHSCRNDQLPLFGGRSDLFQQRRDVRPKLVERRLFVRRQFGKRRPVAEAGQVAVLLPVRAVASAKSPLQALRRTSSADRPTYGGSPVRISQRMAPSPNTSARRSRLAMSPLACSVGMYAGVPSREPASVSVP